MNYRKQNPTSNMFLSGNKGFGNSEGTMLLMSHPLVDQAINVILKGLPCGVGIFDAEGRIVYYNARFRKSINLRSKSLDGLSLSEIKRPGKISVIRDAFSLARTRLSPEPFSIEIPVGTSRVYYTAYALLSNNEFLGFLIIENVHHMDFLDIRTISKNAINRPMLVHNEQGTITECNLSLLTALSYSPAIITRKVLYELEQDITYEKLEARLRKLRKNRTARFKTVYLSWNGFSIPANVFALYLDDGNGSYVLNLIEFDEVKLRKVPSFIPNHFAAIFDSIPIATFLWDRSDDDDFVLRFFNDAADIITGGVAKSLLQQSVNDIFPNMPEISSALEEAMLSGGVIRGEIPCRCTRIGLDGIFLLSFSKVIPNSVIMTIIDITKHVALQQQLNRQAQELSAFAHDMNHDIKGLLHNIGLSLDLLEEEIHHERIEDIRDTISLIDRMLTDSVNLAESGLTIGPFDCCDLTKVVKSVVKMIVPEDVTVEIDRLPSVKCDERKITQLFLNIIGNALEHGSASKIEISHTKDDQYYNITIKNNGYPIPPKIRKELFKRKISTKSHGGRGLLIVRRIADAHGWAIHLLPDDQPGFRIRIPHRFFCRKK